jgi:CubicO group peptidase (beta-lactamase class C family)
MQTGRRAAALELESSDCHTKDMRSGTGLAARARPTWALLLSAWTVFSGAALAAPDEALLGKAEGYPVCRLDDALGPDRCLVGLFSHFDEAYPARKVARGGPVNKLERVPAEPAISYVTRDGRRSDLDGFLASNRTMGLLVLHGDQILVERYQYDRTAEQRFHSMSMSKTVVAMLIGIALQDGKIRSIDDLAQDYVPTLVDTAYGKTSLRHLLTMSSGVKYVENYEPGDDNAILTARAYKQQSAGGADVLAPFAARPREVPAGTRFYYASSETVTLALALRAAVGVPLADYLSEKVWKPMGAEADASWLIDAGGYELGFVGLNCTLRDWGRVGLLLANAGAVEGRQIIPAAWVHAMTTPDAPHLRVGGDMKNSGYGYQTWLIDAHEPYFALLGLRGQAVIVDPVTKVVVVFIAANALNDVPARREEFSLFAGTVRALQPRHN